MYPELDAKIPFPQNDPLFPITLIRSSFQSLQENTQTSLKRMGTSDNLYLENAFCLSAHSSLGFLVSGSYIIR